MYQLAQYTDKPFVSMHLENIGVIKFTPFVENGSHNETRRKGVRKARPLLMKGE